MLSRDFVISRRPGLRAALAMKTLSKAGEALLPMLAGGSAALNAFVDWARAHRLHDLRRRSSSQPDWFKPRNHLLPRGNVPLKLNRLPRRRVLGQPQERQNSWRFDRDNITITLRVMSPARG